MTEHAGGSSRRRRVVAGALAVSLVAVTAVSVVVAIHRGGTVADTRHDLRASQAQLTAARADATSLRRSLAMASRHDRESADQLHQLEARLGNAGRGGIHSRALAAINGYLDRLAPANSEIVSLRPIRAIGGTPAEVAVVWKGRSQFPDTGFLLWQAHRTLSPDRGLFGSYRRWWLADNWRFDADHRRSFIGLPGQEQRHDDVAGQAFFFTVGDATGDGEPDVLVQFNTEGSASCADWRLLSTDHDIVESILTRSTCDGGVSIADGMVRIKRAVHGPGCSIHGCGDYHRTLLRRAGDHWVVADRSIVGKPYADH